MAPITRSQFMRSRLYLCAIAFKKRNDQRLKHIQDLLEKMNENKLEKKRQAAKKRYVSTWKIPGCDNQTSKESHSREDKIILSANKDESSWVYDKSQEEYVLSVHGETLMKVPTEMYKRLKDFQITAVEWAAFVGPKGGILADDMGMGKTFMSIATLGARMRVKKVRMALIIAPVSVLAGWVDEGQKFLSKFAKNVRIIKVHGKTQKDRAKTVRNAWKQSSYDAPHVIVTSWGLACSARTMSAFLPPSRHIWDYVVLDEAHEIKNHNSNRSKCCRRIAFKQGTRRLLLTGTPFQNDTTELWSIVNMATDGCVLGKLKDFNKTFGKPIRDARNKSAGSHVMKQGQRANDELQAKLKPYLLRRCKMDFLKNELPPKLEICVWVKPSELQKKLYKEKVEATGWLTKDILSKDAAVANKAKMGAFQVLAELRGLCGHPLRLLKGKAEVGGLHNSLQQNTLSSIINGSKKIELVAHMLNGFKAENHKTLVFSQSTQNLDVIQYVLRKQGLVSVCRIDGSVSEKRRQDTVECFQNGQFDCLLVSTGAGGVGLTLTRASRVIIFDPSWNPSQDAQASDRAYRISQTQEVRVYKLFLASSIEEKMYEKQIHKKGLETTIFTEGSMPEARYFDKHELCKVFSQIPDGKCELLKKFKQEGKAQVTDAHRHDLVRQHPSVIGISSHGKIYTQKRKNAFADEANANPAKCLKESPKEGMADTRDCASASSEPPSARLSADNVVDVDPLKDGIVMDADIEE